MGDKYGFKKHKRGVPTKELPSSRIQHFHEFEQELNDQKKINQASRCMDCGVPFCHNACPLGNVIPDFNQAIFENKWREAYQILTSTNNFPEFTGRICPAPCEASCVLAINDNPITIELNEKYIIEKAFAENWVTPQIPTVHTDKNIAIVGSGPSGLACADDLNQLGYQVTVYEKNTKIGGLLRYGIPDFKLEKKIIDRRIHLLQKEGIKFITDTEIGRDIPSSKLLSTYDAVVLCGGSEHPRSLQIEGMNLKGVHQAMTFLKECNQIVSKELASSERKIDVAQKHIIVIGGGDTGSDCIGNSNRFAAKSILQLEIMDKPNLYRTDNNPWPQWPLTLKTTSSHTEGCDREWNIMTKRFLSDDGVSLSGIEVVDIQWDHNKDGPSKFIEKMNSTRVIPCDIVFLAMGFLHPTKKGLLENLQVELTTKGTVATKDFQTSIEKVFSAGDMRRGQSLVVWAIHEGKACAKAVNKYLLGNNKKANQI